MTVTEVAQWVGMTRRSVSMWAQRFLQDGLEGLADKPGRGRQPGLTTAAKGTPARRRQKGADAQQARL